jgi:transposase
VPRIVVIDNASIHKGDVMDESGTTWAKQGLCLYDFPPDSPELNRIEILWKHAKYF